jgi:hypothetical protein
MSTIGNINILFNIYSNEPTNLIVDDYSDWVYANELPSYIQITIPGSSTPKNFIFVKDKRNVFNSHNLGLSCLQGDCSGENYTDLPDGIYTIKVKSSFDNIEKTKYYLKTDRFEVEYGKVLILYGTDKVQLDFMKSMIKIKYTLEVAKANAEDGNFIDANKYFQEASKILKRFVDCKNCL